MSREKIKLGEAEENSLKSKCGIVMPISSIENCSSEHWSEVLSILRDVITNSGFEPNLVSDADDSGIIQKRIIQNLYSNEVIVCDVSCKNPNVMFELGIRLAFDKPTIIIKDDKTDYTFDTSIIEHLSYPRDLRFNKIISFKENLKKKIQATYTKSKEDPNYSTFLKNFGEYKIATLTSNEISSDKFIIKALDELKNEIYQVKRNQLTQKESIVVSKFKKVLSQQERDEARQIVSPHIEEYIKENGISDTSVIWLDKKMTDELINYLATKQEVRKICGTLNILSQITEEYLAPF